MRIMMIAAAAAALSACSPPVPDSGSGVGFGDYDDYAREQRARDAQLTGNALPAPDAVSTESLDTGQTAVASDGSDLAAETRQALQERQANSGEAVVHAIFDLEPTPDEADYDIAFHLVARMKRALVIVFTDLLEATAARPILDAIPVLARRHSVIVAGSTDIDLIDTILTPPVDVGDVLRAAVAVDALDAREGVARQLERAGATVLEARPGNLPAECVRAYLEAKARARI